MPAMMAIPSLKSLAPPPMAAMVSLSTARLPKSSLSAIPCVVPKTMTAPLLALLPVAIPPVAIQQQASPRLHQRSSVGHRCVHMVEVTEERSDAMVNDALDKIPGQFVAKMRNLVILVRDFNEDSPGILGLYAGVSLTERTHHPTGFLPDAIFIYRAALQNMCSTEEQLAHEVKVTVFHELGHYFGFSEEELHRLGWG